jgi:hypothetical protein
VLVRGVACSLSPNQLNSIQVKRQPFWSSQRVAPKSVPRGSIQQQISAMGTPIPNKCPYGCYAHFKKSTSTLCCSFIWWVKLLNVSAVPILSSRQIKELQWRDSFFADLQVGRSCPDASFLGTSGATRRPAEVLGHVHIAGRSRPADAIWAMAEGGPAALLPLTVSVCIGVGHMRAAEKSRDADAG